MVTPRLYANPFVKESVAAHIVSRGPWQYGGQAWTAEGEFQCFYRMVRYSDGTQHSDSRMVQLDDPEPDQPISGCPCA